MPLNKCPKCAKTSKDTYCPKCREAMTPVGKEDVTVKKVSIEKTRLYGGVEYERVDGEWGTKPVYARLDPTLKTSLGDTAYAHYRGAMLRGVIASKSTGQDGIKKEPDDYWYVKVSLKNKAAKQTISNVESPRASEEKGPDCFFLNFSEMAKRH